MTNDQLQALGTYCEITVPPTNGLSENGTIGGVIEGISADALNRRRRFRLQAHARWLLRNDLRKNRNGYFVSYRVGTCLWAASWQLEGGACIAKLTNAVNGDKWAVYRMLQICASVWHCPVCAARIANERRGEIYLAVKIAEKMGYRAILVTYTARHDSYTDLSFQLEMMTKAHEMAWSGNTAKKLKNRSGYLGMIRTLECTHSNLNGWHPHIHAIIFIRDNIDIQWFSDTLRARWKNCALKHGLTMDEHGFDLMDSSTWIADYIAKWGHEPKWREADELARWHTKKGHVLREYRGHYSPWQLLEFSAAGDATAGELWREYALVYYGRRQLHWSKGLRNVLGMKDALSDEEAAEKEREDMVEELKVFLEQEQWEKVRRFPVFDIEEGKIKYHDKRTGMLELVEKYDAEEIIDQCEEYYGFTPEVLFSKQPKEEEQRE